MDEYTEEQQQAAAEALALFLFKHLPAERRAQIAADLYAQALDAAGERGRAILAEIDAGQPLLADQRALIETGLFLRRLATKPASE